MQGKIKMPWNEWKLSRADICRAQGEAKQGRNPLKLSISEMRITQYKISYKTGNFSFFRQLEISKRNF